MNWWPWAVASRNSPRPSSWCRRMLGPTSRSNSPASICYGSIIAEIAPISSTIKSPGLCSESPSRYRFATCRNATAPDTLETRTFDLRTSPFRRRVSKDRNGKVHLLRPLLRASSLNLILLATALAVMTPRAVHAEALLVVEADSGLKMMMVKSANDMAVVLAEGVGGSVDGFSAIMNQTALRLGMTQTSYVNPNGLPADGQITSARDLAMLARAVIRDLPEYEYFMQIPSIRYGRRVTQNFNKLIGRYPGADGFKTGFICASGYNLVASATRNGKRLIAVVLGASSGQARAVRAAQLLERGFGGNGLGWLKPALGTVDNLVPIDATPPNLRDEMCNGKRKRPATDEDPDIVASNGNASTGESAVTFFTAGL